MWIVLKKMLLLLFSSGLLFFKSYRFHSGGCCVLKNATAFIFMAIVFIKKQFLLV
jgi:hypothetical protein